MTYTGFNTWPSTWKLGWAKQIKAAGLNTVRVQFLPEAEGYENQLRAFHDVMLPDCHAAGLQIIIAPWVKSDNWGLYGAAWNVLIPEYDHRACVVAYDLMNEPKDPEYVVEIDMFVDSLLGVTRKPLIIQFGKGPDISWIEHHTPVNRDNVIYSFHAYEPYPFTHQGLDRDTGLSWPGEYYGYRRDASFFERRYGPVIEFQEKYGVPILVGEMGVSKGAHLYSSIRWLKDMITFCNNRGWGWMIHSFNSDDWPSRLPIVGRLASSQTPAPE